MITDATSLRFYLMTRGVSYSCKRPPAHLRKWVARSVGAPLLARLEATGKYIPAGRFRNVDHKPKHARNKD